MHVYGYVRRSRHDDDSSSIAKQEQILRDYAARHGHTLVGIAKDANASATKTGLDRPGLSEARDAVRSGVAEAILCWRLDRVARSVVDFSKILDDGAQVISATEPLDTTSAMGMAMVQIIQVFAQLESRITGDRLKQTKAYLKSQGRWTGGPRPYGYRPVKAADGIGKVLVVDPVEAEVVRRIFHDLLVGVPVNRIARDLEAEGVPTPNPYRIVKDRKTGEPLKDEAGEVVTVARTWTPSSVLNIGRALHVSGYQTEAFEWIDNPKKPGEKIATRERRPVVGADGEPVVIWEPIVDLDTADRVRAMLTREAIDEARAAATREGHAAPKRLLEGLALCTCGKPLIRRNRRGVAYYGCRGLAEGSHILVEAEKAEAEAEAQFLAQFSGAEVVSQIRTVTTSAALDEVGRALAAAFVEASRASGAELPEVFARIAELTAEKERLAASASRVLTRRTRESYGDAWDRWTTEEKREHMAAVGVSVRILPAARRGSWDPSRIRLIADLDYLAGQTA